jgi:hypothetical protein
VKLKQDDGNQKVNTKSKQGKHVKMKSYTFEISTTKQK